MICPECGKKMEEVLDDNCEGIHYFICNHCGYEEEIVI